MFVDPRSLSRTGEIPDPLVSIFLRFIVRRRSGLIDPHLARVWWAVALEDPDSGSSLCVESWDQS